MRISDWSSDVCSSDLLVSHDVEQIDSLCDDVLFLKGGRMVAYGPRQETLALYAATLESKVSDAHEHPLPALESDPRLEEDVNRYGSGKMEKIGRAHV